MESLRREFLKLLEQDEEFRMAVMGYLGIRTVLEELKRLANAVEEHSRAIREMQAAIKSLQEAVTEHGEAIRELQQAVAEHSKTIRELQVAVKSLQEAVVEHSKAVAELQTAVKGFQETVKGLQQAVAEQGAAIRGLQIAVREHTKAIGELKVAVGSLGKRIGVDLEKAVFNLYRHMIEEKGVKDVEKVQRFVHVDVDGRYYRKGARIEIDVYLHDEELYLLEVKSLVEADDMEWFYEKCKIAERILGRQASKYIIIGVNVTNDALKRAGELGVEVIAGSVID